MYYRIQSDIAPNNISPPTNGPLYLSINNNDPTGALIVNTRLDDDSQLWQPIALVTNSNNTDAYQGIVLVNKKSGLVAQASNEGGPVQQVNLSGDLKYATWNIVGSAVQLRNNTNLNLNVSGDAPYRAGGPVLAYDKWKHGQPNETWTWVAADFTLG